MGPQVNYDGAKAYKGSKIALALFAKELAVRTEGTNISVFAADPGPTGELLGRDLQAVGEFTFQC